ncbi:unnamed protein product, partial [Mesorhabditis belari]|uniref:Uncharacterized protein n=1 Tax=Mesorhabditis belari TaxID=2138241 RepID=A0AAF3J996_9BILA
MPAISIPPVLQAVLVASTFALTPLLLVVHLFILPAQIVKIPLVLVEVAVPIRFALQNLAHLILPVHAVMFALENVVKSGQLLLRPGNPRLGLLVLDFRKISFAPATSPSMRAARTSSNASLSASRPSRPISQSPSQNARGRLSSDSSVKTARLASRSPSINTACSPASTPANTAHTRSDSSVHTGRPSSIPDASTAPANGQIVAPTNVILLPVQGEDSVHEIVNPSQLVRTPSSDKRFGFVFL